MNKILIALFIFSVFGAEAQDLRVPFRIGDKIGLSDIDGNIKVEAIYDEIDILDHQYFKYTNVRIDSVQSYRGMMADKVYTTGVIYEDKVVVKDQKYSEYLIYKDQFIAGSYNPYRPESCMLFSLSGKEILKQREKAVYINDRDFTPFQILKDPNICFLAIFHKIERGRRPMSLAVYNIKEERITKFLIERCTEFKLLGREQGKNLVACVYKDENGIPANGKCIAFNSLTNEFEMVDVWKAAGKAYENTSGDTDLMEDVDVDEYYIPATFDLEVEEPEVVIVEEEMEMGEERVLTKPKKKVYFKVGIDSTIRYGDKVVPDIPGSSIVCFSKYQLNPIIYKQKGKFGIIRSDQEKTAAIYDSLMYFHQRPGFKQQHIFRYLTGTKNTKTGEWKYGVIDQFGNEIIPANYDALKGYIPHFYYESKKDSTYLSTRNPNRDKEKKNVFVLGRNNWLTASLNGKWGLIDIYNHSVTDIHYDAIIKNELGHDNFYVFGKDGQYGFIVNPKDVNDENILKAIKYPYLPIHLIKDYAGKKGFNLVGLAKTLRIFCYAREDGFLYKRK